MSESKQVKDAVQEAKNDLEKEKQNALKDRVKSIIKATLEKIEIEEAAVKEHQDRVSILRKDLKDLETGRLDLIEERQQKDPKAKEVSIVIVKKVEKSNDPFWEYKPWYWPFDIMPNSIIRPTSSATSWNSGNENCTSSGLLDTFFTLTGSNMSSFVPGTYELNSGNIIDIRPRF